MAYQHRRQLLLAELLDEVRGTDVASDGHAHHGDILRPIFCQQGRELRLIERNDVIGQDVEADLLERAGQGLSPAAAEVRSEEHTSELQSRENLVCRLL